MGRVWERDYCLHLHNTNEGGGDSRSRECQVGVRWVSGGCQVELARPFPLGVTQGHQHYSGSVFSGKSPGAWAGDQRSRELHVRFTWKPRGRTGAKPASRKGEGTRVLVGGWKRGSVPRPKQLDEVLEYASQTMLGGRWSSAAECRTRASTVVLPGGVRVRLWVRPTLSSAVDSAGEKTRVEQLSAEGVCVCVRPVPPVGLFGLPVAAVGSVASSRIARPGARPRAGQWVSVGAVRHRRTAPRLSSRGRGVSDWMHDVASPDGGGRAVRVAVSVPRSRALDCTRGTAVGRGASPFVVVRRAAGEAPTPRGAPASREADVKVFGGSAPFSAPTHIESVRMSLRRPRSRDGGGLLCKGGERLPAGSLALLSVTWLILPVVICLSQRLSHACLSMNASYCETANGSLNQL